MRHETPESATNFPASDPDVETSTGGPRAPTSDALSDLRSKLTAAEAERDALRGAIEQMREALRLADESIQQGQACRSEGEFARWMHSAYRPHGDLLGSVQTTTFSSRTMASGAMAQPGIVMPPYVTLPMREPHTHDGRECVFPFCDQPADLLPSPPPANEQVVSPTKRAGEWCRCGHAKVMHPFGLSENIICSGTCNLCDCRGFVDAREDGPSPPPR